MDGITAPRARTWRAELAQGHTSGESSAHALKGLKIAWPDRLTRADFPKTAGPLHASTRAGVRTVKRSTPHHR